MMLNFAKYGHPIFRASSVLERGELRSKNKGKKSTHFNGSEKTVDFFFRFIISLIQLSIHGAVTDLCKETSKDSEVAEKPPANEDLESMKIPAEHFIANFQTNAELQKNLLQDYEHKFEHFFEDQKLSKLCPDADLKIVEKGQFVKHLMKKMK